MRVFPSIPVMRHSSSKRRARKLSRKWQTRRVGGPPRVRRKVSPAMVEKGFLFEVRGTPCYFDPSGTRPQEIAAFLERLGDHVGGKVKGTDRSLRRIAAHHRSRVVLFLKSETELAILRIIATEAFPIEAIYRLEPA